MCFHTSGTLRTLMIFPSLFKGEHIKHTEYTTIIEAKEVSVEFDVPCALQIDGETIRNVKGYTVKAY